MSEGTFSEVAAHIVQEKQGMFYNENFACSKSIYPLKVS